MEKENKKTYNWGSKEQDIYMMLLKAGREQEALKYRDKMQGTLKE